MRSKHIFFLLCIFSVFGMLSGCTPSDKPGGISEDEFGVVPGEEPNIPSEQEIEDVEFVGPSEDGEIVLEQKFLPGESFDYNVITEAARKVDFSGAMKDNMSLQGGRTGTRVEMTFNQEVESVDEEGNATAKITIKALKYFFEERSVTKIDFDSSTEEAKSNPFSKLIGQSYRIKISPSGEVSKVMVPDSARASVTGASEQSRRAAALLDKEVINRHHEIAGLPESDEKLFKTGAHWSDTKDISFGTMGAKSYEKMYKVKGISQKMGQKIVAIEMNAIPTAESAQELYKQNQNPSLTQLFDNIEKYTGELKLNLDTGKVITYYEQMHSKWIMVQPESIKEGTESPDTITMESIRFHQLDKLD